MSNFTKETEHYIEHEVQIRLHDAKFQSLEKSIDRLDSSIRHLDNKFMLMFSIFIGINLASCYLALSSFSIA